MAKVLNTVFRGTDGGLIGMMKDTKLNAEQLQKKMLELKSVGQGGEDGSKTLIQNLKANLGARSDLGQIGKMLKGGGAIAAISIIGSELKEAATNALELKNQLQAGTISAGEFQVKMLESLPFVGQLVSAGSAIDDFAASFDGFANSWFGKLIKLNDMNYAQHINKELAATKDSNEYIAKSLERQVALTKEIGEEHRKNVQEAIKSTLQGDDLKNYELKIGAENRLAEIESKRQAALKQAEKEKSDAFKKIHAAGNSLQVQADLEVAPYKRAEDEKLKINQDFDSQLQDADRISNDEAAQNDREHAEKMQGIKEEALKAYQDSQSAAMATHLKDVGDNLGAELLMIKKNAQDKKDAILKELKEQVKGASQLDQGTFNRIAQQQIASIDTEASESRQLAIKKQQLAVVEALQDGQVAALKQAADQGDEMAQQELKRLETAKQTNEEQRKLLDLLKQQLTPLERQEALDELAELRTANRAGIIKALNDQKMDVLKQQSEFGGTGADRKKAKDELEALQLKKDLQEAQIKTAAILQNPNATAEDKKEALDNLKAYTNSLGAQYDKETKKLEPPKSKAELQERGLLITGVAASARTTPIDRVAKNSDAAVKLQQDANKLMQEFLKQQAEIEKNRPKIVTGVSD
jgi:hypothetical protein